VREDKLGFFVIAEIFGICYTCVFNGVLSDLGIWNPGKRLHFVERLFPPLVLESLLVSLLCYSLLMLVITSQLHCSWI